MPDEGQTMLNTQTVVRLVTRDHGLGHDALLSSAPVLMIRWMIRS